MKTTPVFATAVAAASTLVDPSAAFSSRHTAPRPSASAAEQKQQQRRQGEEAGANGSNPIVSAEQSSRRDFLGSVAAAAVTGAALKGPEPANAAIKTGAANSFTG